MTKIKKSDIIAPQCEDMVKTAIVALKDRSGSSMVSILKFVKSHWTGVDDKLIKSCVRRMAKEGVLLKTKNSYRLSKKEIGRELKAEHGAQKKYKKRSPSARSKRSTRKKPKKSGRKTTKAPSPEAVPVPELGKVSPKEKSLKHKSHKAKGVRRSYGKRGEPKKHHAVKVRKSPKKRTSGRRLTKKAPRPKKMWHISKCHRSIKKPLK